MKIKITHLLQSCFILEFSDRVLVFDYPAPRYRAHFITDSETAISEFLKDKNVFVFSSHGHADHFSSEIFDWAHLTDRIHFILSSDIQVDLKEKKLNILLLEPNEDKLIADIRVKTYPSTDLGVAFSVYLGGRHIYFSGDNAYWNWENNISEAEFKDKVLSVIDRKTSLDLAFHVCDAALKKNGWGGFHLFAKELQPKWLIPMHSRGEYAENQTAIEELATSGFKGKSWTILQTNSTFELTL